MKCLLRSSLTRLGMPVFENERALLGLKNRHSGQRCFVVGNGPSLRLGDLERLHGEVSIASNRVYVAFSSVSWRPDYFTCIDTVYAENFGKELVDLDLFKIFPEYLKHYLLSPDTAQARGKTVYFRGLPGRFGVNGTYLGNFSANAVRGFHTGPTVTILNLQLAHYMGCRPIYLLGVDGDYKVSSQRASHPLHGQLAVSNGERNHFHPDYRAPGDTYVVPLPDQIEAGYGACRNFLETQGTQIFNASRQTCITVFDRIDIDQVLP